MLRIAVRHWRLSWKVFTDFKPEDPLHITSFRATETIKEVAAMIKGQFNLYWHEMYDVDIKPGLAKDSVQMDKRNTRQTPSSLRTGGLPKTTICIEGIAKKCLR